MNVWIAEYGPVDGTVIARIRRDPDARLYDVQWTDADTGERWVQRALPQSYADEQARDLSFNPGFDDVVVVPADAWAAA
jgi:hypothetical protein